MQTSSDADKFERHHQAHLRDRRCRFLVGQGPHRRQPGQPADRARAARRDAEARPVPERRPGHDEPVPARRGLRDRRRRRDRPRHRALRALPRHRPQPGGERHDRPDLLAGHRARAPRRVPRRHRPGDPAHHRRDQAPHAAAGRRGAAARRHHHRDRRHGRRHRVAAVHRVGPPDPPRARAARTSSSSTSRSCRSWAPRASRRPSPRSTPSRRSARSASSPTRSCCAATGPSPRRTSARSRSCATSTSRPSSTRSTCRASTTSPPCSTSRVSTTTSCARSGSRRPPRSTGRGWQRVLQAVHNPKHEVTIGLVGKYIDLPDAYLSVTEALKAGGFAQETQVKIRWIPSDACETPEGAAKALGEHRRDRRAGRIRHPRHRGQARRAAVRARAGHPDARDCASGLQCMVIEYARHVAGLDGASSSEFDPDTELPVIATMAEQVDILDQRRPGRHDAPRPLPGRPRRGLARGGAVRLERASRSATGTATRSTTATATRSPRRASCSRASRPTATSSSTSSCRATCTRTTSPRRRTPSCARGRPTRIRCSAGSSARRSSVTARASCSTSTNG